jgi:hypothetical protein
MCYPYWGFGLVDIKRLTLEELISVLRGKQAIKHDKKENGCVTCLLRADINLNDEIKLIMNKMGGKYRPINKVENNNAKKLIAIMRDLQIHKGLPTTGILILIEDEDVNCYQMPYDLNMSFSPLFDTNFHLDKIIVVLTQFHESEKRQLIGEYKKMLGDDQKRLKKGEIEIFPGKFEVESAIDKGSYNVSRVYVNENDKGLYLDILDKARKTGIEIIELPEDNDTNSIFNNYEGILAFSYWVESKPTTVTSDEDSFIRNEKRYFRFNDRTILQGFDVVDSVKDYVETELSRTPRSIYYVNGKRGDGKTQSLQYIIRNYLERIDELHFLPIDCQIRIRLDENNNNIIDFWEYLKRGFRDMIEKISSDPELYNKIKGSSMYPYLEGLKKIEDWQKSKGYSDEQAVIEAVKLIKEKSQCEKIVIFIDELDKPPFRPVIYNFLNHNQHSFSKLFENGCVLFICADFTWHKDIHKDSNLNFYMGTNIDIPSLISQEQCINLITKRYEAFGQKPPIHIPLKGYKYILEVSGGIRRTIIGKYMLLVTHCETEKKNELGLEEIKTLLVEIPSEVKAEIAERIRTSSNLLDIFKDIYETGDSYLDTIQFTYRYADTYPLFKIDFPNKRLEIQGILNKNGLDLDEFADGWKWMRAANIIDHYNRLTVQLKTFLSDMLTKLNPTGSDEMAMLVTPKALLENVNRLYNEWATPISIKVPMKISQTPIEKVEVVQPALHPEIITPTMVKPDVIADQESSSIAPLDGLVNELSLILEKHKDELSEDIFKALESTAREKIVAHLDVLYKTKHLGNLTFTKDGLVQTFSKMNASDKEVITHLLEPPMYVRRKPAIYIHIVESFVEIITTLETDMEFSINELLSKWVNQHIPITQYSDLLGSFQTDGAIVKIIDLIYHAEQSTSTIKRGYFSRDELSKLNINQSEMDFLVYNDLFHKGSLYRCERCNQKIMVVDELSSPPVHISCNQSSRKPLIETLVKVEDDLYYINPNKRSLVYSLRIIYGYSLEKRFKEIFIKPSLGSEFKEIDVIMLTYDGDLIGLKVVDTEKEMKDIEKARPKIFRDFWYLSTSASIERRDRPFISLDGNIEKWIEKRLNATKKPQVNELIKFNNSI